MSTPITPLTPAQVAAKETQAAKEKFLERDLIAVDECVNTLTDGPPDETISSRWAIDAVHGHGVSKVVGVVGSKVLDLFQRDHGADAEAGDLERAQAESVILEHTGTLE